MWIERVVARAFGPLIDRTLEFAPGMTVVAGPNEAGKTSWQVATRLALTGMRRGPGQNKVAASLIERHRPWDQPDRWEVEALLHLADGRTVEMSQDLLGRVACRARDAVLGEDVSSEIINEGTPDASVWLGLDRESFASTASVSQAQILAVADSAGALQEHMQRAAATRGTDATAAEAIERLRGFRKDAVGADTVVAKGPLRAAMRELESGESALAEARRRHVGYLERSARLEDAERRLATARGRERVVRAEAARAAAAAAQQRAERAKELTSLHPQRPVPLEARDAAADEVTAAIAAWERRPLVTPLGGPSSAEIEQRLRELPQVEAGDRRSADTVLTAVRRLDLAEEALRVHRERRPAESPGRVPVPGRAQISTIAWLVAGLLAVAGAAVAVAGRIELGVVIAAAGIAVAGWRWSRAPARSDGSAPASERDQLARHGAEDRVIHQAVTDAGALVLQSLAERGAPVEGEVREMVAGYEQACLLRQAQAEAAAGADGLQQALAARRALEESTDRARQAAVATEAALQAVAARLGLGAGVTDPETLVVDLVAWRGERATEAQGRERAILEWQELQALLGHGSLSDLEAEASVRSAAARDLAAEVEGEQSVDGTPGAGSDGLSVERANEAVKELVGELREMQRDLPEVAEAEERVDAARAELDRVRSLAGVVDEAVSLLESAERRVHRDLAPVLKESIQRWLPAVSDAAYTDATVNPRDLSIEVKEARSGQWRDARLLSEGTREQIYLLLRVAMAEHLVTPGEVAPLLLDEVTAQSDAPRKRQVLEVLHAVSVDRQVILFTHDAEVMAWADSALVEPRDRLVRLAGW